MIRIRFQVTLALVGLVGAPAGAVPFRLPSKKAISSTGTSTESASLVGWTDAAGRPLSRAARDCRLGARTGTKVPASKLAIPGKPSLGGNYWDVPVEAGGLPHGRCALRLAGRLTRVRSPALAPSAAKRYLSVFVSGKATVRLLAPFRKPVTKFWSRPVFGRVVFNLGRLSKAQRKGIRLEVRRAGSGEVLVDDLRLGTKALPSGVAPSGLFGFADLHTHFFQQLGSGGRMFHGRIHSCIDGKGRLVCKTRSNPKVALGECGDNHGRHGKGVSTVVVEQGHDRGGYPMFKGWPRSTTMSHQQMYVDWLRRAWRGGLRVAMMDVGHNNMFALGYDLTSVTVKGNRMPNPWKDDEWNIERQIAATKAFATLPDVRDFLAIAYTPADLRRIVESGKLAVVLGVEVDNFGRFNASKDFWRRTREADPRTSGVSSATRARARKWIRSKVRPYVAKLHKMGVRHFFPIHVFDSVFGGAAVYDLKLEAGSFLFHKIYGAGERFSELRGDATKIGVFNRVDLEIREIEEKVRGLLEKAELAELFTSPAAAAAVLPIAFPILAPILGILGPGLGSVVIGATGALAATIHFLAKALKLLDKKLGLRRILHERVSTLPKHGKGLVGIANRRGLSPAGEILIDEIMRLGWLLDVSHMSDRATNETLERVRSYGFPVMAGHTGFRDTSFGSWTNVPANPAEKRVPAHNTKYGWGDVTSAARFGTANAEALSSERSLSLKQIRAIDALGGMIGIGTGAAASPISWRNRIPADCDGSTKRFVQDYLYAIENVKVGGVALGTDANGFAGGTKPRFGTHACGSAKGDALRGRFVSVQARRQKNGVRYREQATLPMWDRFDGPVTLADLPSPPGDVWNFMGQLFGAVARDARPAWQQLQEEEQITWMAIAKFNAGLAKKGAKPFGCDVGNRSRERDMERTAWGFRRAADGLPRPGTDCPMGSDTNADSKAAWDTYRGTKKGWQDVAKTLRFKRIWRQFKAMNGNNPALKKSRMVSEIATPAGKRKFVRDFDYNLEGLAHYGLLPDMLQDARNVGLRPQELAPLFQGAEKFARMWEKAEASAKKVRKAPRQ